MKYSIKYIEYKKLRFTKHNQINESYKANPFLILIQWSKIVKENKSNMDIMLNIGQIKSVIWSLIHSIRKYGRFPFSVQYFYPS
ncbi:hypothetical protein R8G64_09780 [Tenacibaculum maritimum]